MSWLKDAYSKMRDNHRLSSEQGAAMKHPVVTAASYAVVQSLDSPVKRDKDIYVTKLLGTFIFLKQNDAFTCLNIGFYTVDLLISIELCF